MTVLILVTLCAAASLARSGVTTMGLVLDNQLYYYAAERVASGTPPHLSLIDPKTSLSMILSGGAIAAGRVIGIDDLIAARLVSIAAAVLAVVSVTGFVLRQTGCRWGALGSAAAMLGMTAFMTMAVMGCRPKVFAASFVAAGLWALATPRLAGVLLGAAVLCWQPTVLVLLLALAIMPSRRRIFIAAVVTALSYELYFLWHGHDALAEQLRQEIVMPALMLHGTPSGHAVVRRLHWLAGTQYGYQIKTIAPMAGVIAMLWQWAWAVARPRRAVDVIRRRRAVTVAAIGLPLMALLTLWDFQGFPDRFLVEPFMAIAVGILIARLPGRVAAPVALVALTLVTYGYVAQELHMARRGLERDAAAVTRVGELLAEGKRIHAIGPLHLLAFHRAENASPYGFYGRAVIRDYAKRFHPERPLLDGDVVLVSRAPAPIRRELSARYERVADSIFAERRIEHWRSRR